MKLDNRDRVLAILLALVLLVTATFWRVRSNDFIDFDDDYLIYKNVDYSSFSADNLAQFWRAPYAQIYMPLTYTAWSALTQIARVDPATEKISSNLTKTLDPSVFHSFSLLLHVMSTLVVFALLRVLVRNDWASALGTLFWALHPVQVESVAWASELKGVLSGFFGVMALWLYAVFCVRAWDGARPAFSSIENRREEHSSEPDNSRFEESAPVIEAQPQLAHPNWFYLAATLSFTLALLSKPAAASLPFIAFLLDWWLRRSPRRAALPLLIWLVLCIPIFYMAKQGQPMTQALAPLWTRPLVMLDALAFYLAKIFWPLDLRVEYSRSPDWVYEQGYFFWTWILPVSVLALLWWQRKRVPGLLLGFCVFVAALLPVSGLIPFVFQYYSTVADRYLYLPLLGMGIGVAWLIARYPARRIYFGVSALTLVLGVLSWNQLGIWKDRQTLYRSTVERNPRSWQARVNLAIFHEEHGDEKKAQSLLASAKELRPKYGEPYNNMGAMLMQHGKVEEAIGFFVHAIENDPLLVRAYGNLAEAYIKTKDYKYALLALRRANEIKPNVPTMKLRLAELYLRQNRAAEAEKELEELKPLFPDRESYHVNVALMYTRLKRWPDVLKHYVEAVKVRPENAALHNDIGMTLLQLKRPAQAVKVLQNAARIEPNDTQIQFNLALALLSNKQVPAALQHLNRALELNPNFSTASQLRKQIMRMPETQGSSGTR